MWDFLKIDGKLTFHDSVPLAAVYLLCIPMIRGICNLDNMQSADCLLQSVSLLGVILIVPILRRELPLQIREVLAVKAWGYRRTVCIRSAAAFGGTAVLIGIFAAVMQGRGCVFPFWETTLQAIAFSWLLGSAGLVSAWVGKSMVTGYLGALGCYGIIVLLR